MKKILFSAIVAFVLSVPASAQQVDAAYTYGKTFDVPAAEFTAFHIPEVELRVKQLSFGVKWYFDAFTGNRDISELSAKWNFKITPWSKKLTYSIDLRRFDYYTEFTGYDTRTRADLDRRGDWTYALSARYPLKR